MQNWIRCCVALLGLCLVAHPLPAQQPNAEEDDELRLQFPGIWGTYSGGGKTVTRRDPDVAFVWHDPSPLQQLPQGPFQVTWKGTLLVRAPGKYRIHAHLQGEVAATLAGQKVLTAQTDQKSSQWVSGPEVDLEFGQLPLEVEF